MKKFHGGQPVGRGAYGHVRDARMIAVQDGEILPGEQSAVYYRIPVVLVFPLGLLFGGLYVALLPIIAAGTAIAALGQRFFGGALVHARRSVSFGWRPTEAYLAGRSVREEEEEAEKEVRNLGDLGKNSPETREFVQLSGIRPVPIVESGQRVETQGA